MTQVIIHDVFTSIQGESSYAGLPCFFIRVAGCNLRCDYCDTPEAQNLEGTPRTPDVLVAEYLRSSARMAEITGGEPLRQPACPDLVRALRAAGADPVLVETNGSWDISVLPDDCLAVVDVKCPDSGESDSFLMDNLAALRPRDEVKFVISSHADYEFARDFVRQHDLVARCATILFSPVQGRVDPGYLGQWILEDGLQVRLQLQLHKLLRMK